MADAAGRITTLEVRCPCGKSFENAETYIRHKSFCGTHRQEENAIYTTPSSNRRLTTVTAKASISASSPKPVTCWCGRMFKNHHALRKYGCYCALHKQTNADSNSSNPPQVLELISGGASVSTARERRIPPAEFTAKKIQCPCGQSFTNENALNKHLRYSKTHRAGKPRSASPSKAEMPGSVPFTAPHSPPTSIPPASGPVPGTIPYSVLSLVSLFPCTCGHVFETQRVLDLHKRDSLLHKRQADESLTRYEKRDNSLASSFASLNLSSVSTRVTPSVARFSCMCGRIFTNQKALEQHKRDAGRHVWQEKGERREKIFKTPRPQYQEDEYLRDIAAVLARQYCGGE